MIRGTRFRAAGVLAVVLLACAIAPAGVAAQARGVPVGEYQWHVTRATAGPTLPAARVAAANALLDAVVPVVRRHPDAGASPPDMCVRMTSHAYASDDGQRAAVEVSVMFPIVIDGQCYGLTTSALNVHVNDARLVFRQRVPLPGRTVEGDDAQIFMPLRPQPSPTGHPRYGEFVAITRPGVPLFLPLPRERYLQALERGWQASLAEARKDAAAVDSGFGGALARWLNGGRAEQVAETERALKEMEAYLTREQIAEMRRNFELSLRTTEESLRQMAATVAEQAPLRDGALADIESSLARIRGELAALSPAQRALPTCLVAEHAWESAGPMTCDASQQPIVPNPAYWDRGLTASAAQLILVRVGGVRPGGGESDEGRRTARQYAMQMRLFEGLDYEALAALVR
jgi:hypothetical protein